MSKNIIVCSDGTGNSAVKGRGTSVFKVFEAVNVYGHRGDPPKREQVAIYDDGVGTQKVKLIRLLAGAFGFGLARNVRQLYIELARTYRPGDDIYLFGFSRGAFTVRTLAGFVDHAGILDPSRLSERELRRAVGDLYRAYRKKSPAWLERLATPVTDALRRLRRKAPAIEDLVPHPDRTIHFVGVWDTVDSVGFPVPLAADLWNVVIHRFKFTNRDLPACVKRACHALAIDEERASFAPTLWNHDGDRTEQVWFPGVHSNVGGGYPKQGMSLVALDWMLKQAEEASGGELLFASGPRAHYRESCNVHDELYDSRAGLAVYYRYRPRNILEICNEIGAPVRIHHAAIERIRRRTWGYAPYNLPRTFEVVGSPGDAKSQLLVHGRVRREIAPAEGGPSDAVWNAAGPACFWVRWRQGVQAFFFLGQIALIAVAAFVIAPVAESALPSAQEGQRVAAWLLGAAEAAVAPLPTELAQKRVVHPMFVHPPLGIAFLLLFPVAYILGLIGRTRIEDISSDRWRRTELVRIPSGGSSGTGHRFPSKAA